MLNKLNNSEFLKKSKVEVEYLSQQRFIKKNLIHIHGIPKSIAIISLLKSEAYLGQYGTIIKFIMTYKVNPENNKKAYSAYITYSNKLEAAIAILWIDSLLIEGKIIRAFYGTTKYCNYFLNNKVCPNSDKCGFLHIFINDKNFIIDNNNNSFTYEEHLNLAKKIFNSSNLKIKYLLEKKNTNQKPKKTIFPPIDFIFLNEEEKEKYFTTGDTIYIKNTNTNQSNVSLNGFDIQNKNLIFSDGSCDEQKKMMNSEQNNYASELSLNYFNKKDKLSHKIFDNKRMIYILYLQ